MNLYDELSRIIALANKEIMEIYANDFDVEFKADSSPVTEADLRANRVISDELRKLDPSIPVVSEETQKPHYETRSKWMKYWLVDPLDGTRDFVGRRGYFTVNIALVESNRPTLGIVSWPTENTTYFGDVANRTALKIKDGDFLPIRSTKLSYDQLNVIMSFRHGQEKRQRFLEKLTDRFQVLNTIKISSSLKLCRIAEGSADLYPQLDGTSEWDTAAAQAVLEAAGGQVIQVDGKPLSYNCKQDFLNPSFLGVGSCDDELMDFLLEMMAES